MSKRKLKPQAQVRAKQLETARSMPTKPGRYIREAALTRIWIDVKHLQDESALQELAWVEYRYMTPLARTELFTRIYRETYLTVYAERFPDADISKKNPCEVEFARNSESVMTSLWRARALVDAMGVPYDVALGVTLRANVFKDRWNNPPRPNQLYGKLVAPRLQGLPTQQTIAERLYSPHWDPRFFAAAYRNDPVQNAAIDLLTKVVSGAEDRAGALAEYMCERHAITMEKAIDVFGEDLVRNAIARGGRSPIERMSDKQPSYVPACIGLACTHDDDSHYTPCPDKTACNKVAARISDEVIAITGSANPREDHKRKGNKERQQRWRDNQKAQQVASTTPDMT